MVGWWDGSGGRSGEFRQSSRRRRWASMRSVTREHAGAGAGTMAAPAGEGGEGEREPWEGEGRPMGEREGEGSYRK